MSLISNWTCAPTRTPTIAGTTIKAPRRRSTWPSLRLFKTPTIAFGNLWAMLLATAVSPSTPMLIIPGVRTKAPPEPMNPLKTPPKNPRTINEMMITGFRSMKESEAAESSTMVSIPCSILVSCLLQCF